MKFTMNNTLIATEQNMTALVFIKTNNKYDNKTNISK